MTGALIILLITIGVGTLLYVYDLKWRRKHPERASQPLHEAERPDNESSDAHGEICCGRHLVCEKSLVPEPGEKPVYYDDEELDRFAGKGPEEYSDAEIDEIRDVLLTLLPQDIPGWARSIQLRNISLPTPLRDELFILLEDCK